MQPKVIIIGATSGMGKALAEILVANNYKVGITGRREALLNELVKKYPNQVIARPIDIQDTVNTLQQLTELKTALGGLDLLVISAGIGDMNPQLDFTIEHQTIATNVIGFTAIADWAFRVFSQQQSGHLAAITSIAGIRGGRHAPAYNASKAFQINYLEGLRQRASHGKMSIVITDLRPGFVATDMAKGEGLFWVMPVQKAARQIFTAIKRKKKVAYITTRWGIIAGVLRLIPRTMHKNM
ncbi:MAG: SDR family NAD(P)-dependent oxidoreductase [Candidatus Cyclobacteriaceae bacterium M3_2C_046]